jgi:hypothetical protein
MRSLRSAAVIACLATAVAGCGHGFSAGADFPPGTTFAPNATFAWDADAIRRGGDARLENNPFFEEQLFTAVEAELASRGIVETGTDPDLLIHYHLSVEDHVEIYQADPRSGYPEPRPDAPPGTEVVQYEEGIFVLHVEDADTGNDLWIGWAQGDIGSALESADAMGEWVRGAVAAMFELFPT